MIKAMMIMMLVLAQLLTTGCFLSEVKEPPPRVVEVKVPVIVDCLGKLPEKPKFIKDAELILLNRAAFVTALHIDRLERDMYMAQLEVAIEGCRVSSDIPPAPEPNKKGAEAPFITL